MADPIMEGFGVPTHPLADQMVSPKWAMPGLCMCGATLPAMSEWENPGRDWSSVTCGSCCRGFVDEGDYIAIYDDGLDQDGGD